MAARIKKIFHDEDTRLRIGAARIINRVQRFALAHAEEEVIHTGDGRTQVVMRYTDEQTGEPVPAMTPTQVQAALALLHKVLPNLQSVEVSREDTKTYVFRAPPPAEDGEKWLEQYGPKVLEHETKQ